MCESRFEIQGNPRRRLIGWTALLTLNAPAVWAQATSTGTVSGQVTDRHDAVIVGAGVVLRDTSTNIARTTLTNEVGRYIVLNVAPDRAAAFSTGATTRTANPSTNNSQSSGQSDGGFAQALDPRNLGLERGRSDWDRGHIFSASFSYQLPVGRGKKLLARAGKVTNGFLSGWQLAGAAAHREHRLQGDSLGYCRIGQKLLRNRSRAQIGEDTVYFERVGGLSLSLRLGRQEGGRTRAEFYDRTGHRGDPGAPSEFPSTLPLQ
jgi:hypothetical protein